MKIKIKGLKTILIVVITLCISFMNFSTAKGTEVGQYLQYAELMKGLGLFIGTDKGFELTRASTRAEAAVMLVRLLGAEKDAMMQGNQHPFNDVPTWANPYVGYLYKNKLTHGISTTDFGSNQLITPNEYTTFLLRALRYSDMKGEFKWNEALEFAKSIQLISQEEYTSLKGLEKSRNLSRDYMVKMSFNSLLTVLNGSSQTLFDYLYEKQVIASDFFKRDGDNFTIENEMRAVWISYLDLQPLFKQNSREAFRASVVAMYQNVKALGLNTVIVQVRPFGDAIYSSDYFPWSYIITGTEGKNPGYDPFRILVDEAHNHGLRIEAWFNPYRIRAAGSKIALSQGNQGLKWLEDGSNRAIQITQGTFYNPASQEVQDLIIQGVLEVIEKYDIHGVHFDDYFYPSMDLSYDLKEYQAYLSSGGKQSHAEWRRENVNNLIRGVYQSIKKTNSNIQFGISPRNDIKVNYEQLYIDIVKMVKSSQYLDYIAPQIYFGFNHSRYPYETVLEEWNELLKGSTVKLYIGLSPYKIGVEDQWAGEGKQEWISEIELLKRMVEVSRIKSEYRGFMLFRYDSLWKPNNSVKQQVSDEIKVLKNLLNP